MLRWSLNSKEAFYHNTNHSIDKAGKPILNITGTFNNMPSSRHMIVDTLGKGINTGTTTEVGTHYNETKYGVIL